MMRTDELAVDQGTVPRSTLLWTEEPSPGPPWSTRWSDDIGIREQHKVETWNSRKKYR